MTIKVGDKLPHAEFLTPGADGPVKLSTDDIFKGKYHRACTATNDIHVMKAWGKATASEGKIMMLADGNGDFAKACGLDKDLTQYAMGHRSNRYSMIVDNGVVKALNVETAGGVNVSGSETILAQL
jgi:glutaredoxin/glutathione-dependent peroxiredoxin